MDPEEAHDLAQRVLPACQGTLRSLGELSTLNDSRKENLTTSLAGIEVKNPIGLAAGFDKNGRLIETIPSLGFGFAEIGSITAMATSGNPRPRLFRLPADYALINRLGLNGEGATKVAARLRRQDLSFPFGINIAKSNVPNLTGEKAAEDIAFSFKAIADLPLAYVTINTSCPNTHEGALFHLEELEMILASAQAVNSRDLPIFLKLSPDSSEDFLASVVKLSWNYDIQGFICGNTTTSRTALTRSNPALISSIGAGGLSGLPIREGALSQLRLVRQLAHNDQELIACGGIFSAEHVRQALSAGARCVQLYTALVYLGPTAVIEMLGELASGAN